MPTAAKGGSWAGYFINLDRAAERRQQLQDHLGTFGLRDRYERFPAVDGRALGRASPRKPGEVGIFRSHMNVLKKIAEGGRPAHVVEDDVLFCDLTEAAVDNAVNRAIVDQFDILFLETYISAAFSVVNRYYRAYEEATKGGPITSADQLQVVDITQTYQFGATSYVVSPRGAQKLLALLAPEWQRGPTMPVDDLLSRLGWAKRLRIGCVFPFVTTIDLESSWNSTAERDENLDLAMMQRFIRYSFFARRDLARYATPLLERVMARWPAGPQGEALEFYGKIFRYYLTGPQKTTPQ